ncbi:MAG: 8-oxoguanine deaminase [Gammaproteobacteria bacterium]|nr:8-oxoguanine deaminase [Gammaproteobacteria bacterium]
MRTWIKSPLRIFTGSGSDAGNGVVVNGNSVEELVAAGHQPGTEVDEVFDASGLVVIPGLVNTHHHYYQTLTRAVPAALNKALFPWLKSLYPVWAGLNEDMVFKSTQLACAELLLSGCTTSADHHYLFPETARRAMDAQVAAIGGVGIRATVTRGCMSLGEADGGLPPQAVIEADEDILHDCERVIRQYHNRDTGSMMQVALAPCSPFSVSRSLMRDVAVLARAHGVRLHTHLAETMDESRYCRSNFGCTPLQYLESVGWLASDVWLAHGIHFNDDEIRELGNAGVGIAHCPTSNMVLGSGTCQVREMQDAGSPVGLGVDGSASNDCSNMIQEVRQALLLQRLQYGPDRFTHMDALEMATTGSSRCLGRIDIGELSPGKMADLALFRLDEPRFVGSVDKLAALVLSGAHRADYVMVNGQWVVKDGNLPHLDFDRLRHDHGELSRTLTRLSVAA